jgi:two-component sensor histidine kinase
MVTELVINALKHAFPGHRSGKITVGYAARGKGWELTVGDNGVGMPGVAANAVSGLGTSIVSALAKQLSAHVAVKAESREGPCSLRSPQTRWRAAGPSQTS